MGMHIHDVVRVTFLCACAHGLMHNRLFSYIQCGKVILFKRDIKLLLCIVLHIDFSTWLAMATTGATMNTHWQNIEVPFAKVAYYAFIQTCMNIHRYIYLLTQCFM